MNEKLKICLISRYPPCKGGTASSNYWLARTLGDAGHKVFVVTDFHKDSYFNNIPDSFMADYESENIKVFSMDPKEPVSSHVPKEVSNQPYADSLASLAIEVIKKHDVDIIDTKYLFPYSYSGLIAKEMTNKPLIVRHAGSDITYLMKDKHLGGLIKGVLRGADKIACDHNKIKDLQDLGINDDAFIPETGFGVSHRYFREARPFNLSAFSDDYMEGTPVFTSIGKMHKYKGVIELIKAASSLKDLDFKLLFVPEGVRDREFVEDYVKEYGMEDKTIFLDYQPPWVIPSIYKLSTCLVCAEHDHPVPIHSPLAAIEGIHAGTCVIISEETFTKPPFSNFQRDWNVVVVDPKDSEDFSDKLRGIIEDPEKAKRIGKEAGSLHFTNNPNSLIDIYRKLIG